MTQGTDPRTGFFDRYTSYCRGTYDLLGRGTSGFYGSLSSSSSPSVPADVISFQTSRRHWKRLLRQHPFLPRLIVITRFLFLRSLL